MKFIYIDATYFKVRENGIYGNKASSIFRILSFSSPAAFSVNVMAAMP